MTMLARSRVTGTLAVVAIAALATALGGCGNQSPGASASGSSSKARTPPVAMPPIIRVVRLGASFSPDVLRLGTGQKFQLEVSGDVQATIMGVPGHCPAGPVAAAAGLLSVRCTTASSYLFTAERAGSTTLTASVRPRCAPGTACPDWMTAARLAVTVT